MKRTCHIKWQFSPRELEISYVRSWGGGCIYSDIAFVFPWRRMLEGSIIIWAQLGSLRGFVFFWFWGSMSWSLGWLWTHGNNRDGSSTAIHWQVLSAWPWDFWEQSVCKTKYSWVHSPNVWKLLCSEPHRECCTEGSLSWKELKSASKVDSGTCSKP